MAAGYAGAGVGYASSITGYTGSLVGFVGGGALPTTLPAFTLQPESQIVDDTGSATFTTAVNNADGYQWYKNGVPVGEQSQPYTATGMKAVDNGSIIWCKAWKAATTIYSNLVTLTTKSFKYNLNGSNMYGQLASPIVIPTSTDFEYIFNIEIKNVSTKTLTGSITSGRSGVFGWDVTGVLFVRVDSVWRNSSEVIPQTVGDHTVKLKRVSGAYYYSIDNAAFVRIGTFVSSGQQYFDFVGRGYGSSSYAYASDFINRARVYIGGTTSTGTLSFDVKINDKSLEANPVSLVGSAVSIVNHDLARWEAAILPALPSITTQPIQPLAMLEGDLLNLSVVSPTATSYAWYKGYSLVGSGATYQYYVDSADNGLDVFCIAYNGDGYVVSDFVALTVSALPVITTAGYSFESLTSSGDTITSWSDYANSYNVTSMSGVDSFTLNGKGALTVGRGGFVNLPVSLNGIFTDNNTVIVVCSISDMTAPSTIFNAVGTVGAVEIIAYPTLAKVTFKHGTTSYDINVELDQDVHIFAIERNGAVLNCYYDELAVAGVAAAVAGVSSSVICGDFDGLLAETVIFNTNLTDAYKRKFGVL